MKKIYLILIVKMTLKETMSFSDLLILMMYVATRAMFNILHCYRLLYSIIYGKNLYHLKEKYCKSTHEKTINLLTFRLSQIYCQIYCQIYLHILHLITFIDFFNKSKTLKQSVNKIKKLYIQTANYVIYIDCF